MTGDIRRYLGGETVLDEQGNPVSNPDSSTFTRAGGERSYRTGATRSSSSPTAPATPCSPAPPTPR
jgi:hypothetical protein